MHLHLFPTFCVLMTIILIHIPTSSGADNGQYTNCSRWYPCANILDIPYPFWGGDKPEYCGHPSFHLNCTGEAPQITIESRPYRVLAIDNGTFTLNVAQEEFWNNDCPSELHNATINATTHFEYAPNTEVLMLYYGCRVTSTLQLNISTTITIPNRFNCSENQSTEIFSVYVTASLASNGQSISNMNCSSSVEVRVNKTAAEALAGAAAGNVTQVLNSGFGLVWAANNTDCQSCVRSGGRCGTNPTNPGSFVCYCSDQSYPVSCNLTTSGSGGGNSNSIKIVLPIVGAILAGIGLGWLIFSCRQRKKLKAAQSTQAESKDISSPPLSKSLTTPRSNFTRSIPSYPSSKSDFGKASTYFGVQVFSYSELEEATNNFDPSRELGEGGFGTVYYGQLQDGRIVAVKRLYENNFKRVEQFMNEVEILTRLRHDYLVTLFGCTSKRSRELLLVYEYIPNGTVADHLHGKRSNSGLLSWPVRLGIAIETADALTYLHRSDIIHRDVKTNNILLDNDFHVKVADFGLSKLFPNDVTHVSTAPQGTPGYVDPEYYQCYQLTEKSDVYSFGVVLIELISSKQAVDTNRDRLDINLANMAIKKIQNRALHELVDPSLGFETNSSVRRMTTLVAELAFRCLQMERDMRPSMEEVLKALRGIKDDGSNLQVDVVDIVLEDDVGILKDNPPPVSPDSAATATSTEKWVSSSTAPNSIG
ncbi:LEAF RUST 10 DISEASE-RESISTANCE LOCUS RECEPTOR-LIKE PROTEIN KINASE-like 1.4 isoform X2 [Actinidia eriantha]|uniref:LEAF RUST 10 DISEASE-RESISTANCE LOCUS RECEPTOR-LIKE PROTEIN KINASE-like 1.4 isoform X2 n=1 Tax=Actinidia eriantha TaxID=165200 RepID=UPI00258CD121|nr:LEAF RUST 10 DISEASE-RESISTANCE LOCUS RECEPTOR-LIKE PROTEIN KINASE-like 1.4 isoform X2 [Actinidia eriantha]